MTWLLILLHLAIQVIYFIDDRRDARWLPSWRRYAPSLFLALGTLAVALDNKPLGDFAFWAWLIAFAANWYTARRNRRDGNDTHRAQEEARLTEVQEVALARECAEVRP